jgi:hypothetical protein
VYSRSPIDARHLDRSGKDEIGELTGNGAARRLFDFRQVEIEQFVEKVQQFLPSNKVSRIHHA